MVLLYSAWIRLMIPCAAPVAREIERHRVVFLGYGRVGNPHPLVRQEVEQSVFVRSPKRRPKLIPVQKGIGNRVRFGRVVEKRRSVHEAILELFPNGPVNAVRP